MGWQDVRPCICGMEGYAHTHAQTNRSPVVVNDVESVFAIPHHVVDGWLPKSCAALVLNLYLSSRRWQPSKGIIFAVVAGLAGLLGWIVVGFRCQRPIRSHRRSDGVQQRRDDGTEDCSAGAVLQCKDGVTTQGLDAVLT